jgi:hypothetical protein
MYVEYLTSDNTAKVKGGDCGHVTSSCLGFHSEVTCRYGTGYLAMKAGLIIKFCIAGPSSILENELIIGAKEQINKLRGIAFNVQNLDFNLILISEFAFVFVVLLALHIFN